MTAELAAALEQTSFAIAIAERAWPFPTLEIIHVIAISLVVGSISMVDLRLLGVSAQTRPASEVIARVLPWTWSAFVVALIAGALMFASKATSYLANPFFLAKLVLLAVAGVNMLTFHLVTARGIANWDLGTPPWTARAAGGLSLTLWIATVAMGRWMGFF